MVIVPEVFARDDPRLGCGVFRERVAGSAQLAEFQERDRNSGEVSQFHKSPPVSARRQYPARGGLTP